MNDFLYIAGMKAPSLVDEPKKSVAVVYLQGCNFDCDFCHNASLIPMFDKESKKTYLDKLLQRLRENFLIDGVVFTGGEPLLQPNLLTFVEAISGEFEVVAVDTNGTNPNLLQKVSPHLSRVAMDLKSSFDRYEKVAHKSVNIKLIKESIQFLCDRSKNQGRVEFRTTYVPPLVDRDDVMNIAMTLKEWGFSGNFDSHYVLQQFISSEGVREEYRSEYTTAPINEMKEIASDAASLGIPVAIRSQDRGYIEIK